MYRHQGQGSGSWTFPLLVNQVKRSAKELHCLFNKFRMTAKLIHKNTRCLFWCKLQAHLFVTRASSCEVSLKAEAYLISSKPSLGKRAISTAISHYHLKSCASFPPIKIRMCIHHQYMNNMKPIFHIVVISFLVRHSLRLVSCCIFEILLWYQLHVYIGLNLSCCVDLIDTSHTLVAMNILPKFSLKMFGVTNMCIPLVLTEVSRIHWTISGNYLSILLPCKTMKVNLPCRNYMTISINIMFVLFIFNIPVVQTEVLMCDPGDNSFIIITMHDYDFLTAIFVPLHIASLISMSLNGFHSFFHSW